MKKFIVLSASLFLFIVTKSQESHFGVKAGLNAASLNNGGNTGQTKIGFNAGAFAHIHTSLHWTIQPEILFSTEGNRYHLIGGDGQGITSLNYLNFPVLLQYMFNNGLRLEGGAQFSVLVTLPKKGMALMLVMFLV